MGNFRFNLLLDSYGRLFCITRMVGAHNCRNQAFTPTTPRTVVAIRDLDLAVWLGYEAPPQIRELIKRKITKLEREGNMHGACNSLLAPVGLIESSG